MATFHEFHESYYYHNCVITPDKDVLEIDIVGTGCGSRIMRWWHDLFLLSASDERTRGFYSSSHAMSIERYRQFRRYRNQVHPMSKFRNFWDCLILHIFVIYKIMLEFTTTFFFDVPIEVYYLAAAFEIIMILDIYVNVKTGYIDEEAKRVTLDAKKSMENYCTWKLFIHFASAMPIHWIMFLRYGSNITCGLCKTNKFMCAIRLLSIFSVFKVIEMSAYLIRRRDSSSKYHFFKFLRIWVIGFVTIAQVKNLSDVVNLLVVMNDEKLNEASFFKMKVDFYYTPKYSYFDYHYTHVYILANIEVIVKGLFGSLPHFYSYYLDIIRAILFYTISKIFFAWSVVECYYLVGGMLYAQARLMTIRNRVLNLLVCRNCNDEFRCKVGQYFNYRPAHAKVVERDNALYRCLPEVFKKEAKLDIYMRAMIRINLFADWPLPVLEDLVHMLKIDIFLENDIVAEALVEGNGLIIIENGVLAVYSKDYQELGHLIDGDYFGEVSLVTDRELRMSYVVAVTACTVLILEKLAFRKYMRDYPKLFYRLKSESLKKKCSHDVNMENHSNE